MKKKDLDFFKKYLEKRMAELLSQADDTVSGMNSLAETFPDPTDRASWRPIAISHSASGTAKPS